MCDTIIATGLVTVQGKAIFAKNSDRHPNESQHLVHIPAQKHAEGSSLQCTYISIPQVKETFALLLSQPFWMWGAEMGINEHGLVIGNEAVFSKTLAQKTPALLGMDLLRLGLERAVTPEEAIGVITNLLEEFGQGGNNKYHTQGKIFYHNSFIIANHEDAWVLETIDREWVARQIKDTHNISNCLSIQNEWDLASEKIPEKNFNYTKENTDFLYTTAGKGIDRQATVHDILKTNEGKITIKTLTEALRHHKNESPPGNNPTQMDVCMHAGFGLIRNDQSTASMLAYLDANIPSIFATGTSAPCTSIFKPIWVDTPLPSSKNTLTSTYDSSSLFWSHELLHRAVLLNYSERLDAYKDERDALEEEFIKGALALADASVKERSEYAAKCFRIAALAETDWLERVQKIPETKPARRFFDDLAWGNINKTAKMP